MAQRRQELGKLAPGQFETKSQLGPDVSGRAKANGLPFELLACDTFYGRDRQFRADPDGIGDKPVAVRTLAQSPRTQWHQVQVRHTERGLLSRFHRGSSP